MSADNKNSVAPSIARIPVAGMSLKELNQLERLANHLLAGLFKLKATVPDLDGEIEHARQLKVRAMSERKQRELMAAERADKGRVCFEIFSPRSGTPLNISPFDRQRRVVRTPHRRIVHNEFWTIRAEWTVCHLDWLDDFKREQKPVDLAAFAQYGRDVDECWRRHKLRSSEMEEA